MGSRSTLVPNGRRCRGREACNRAGSGCDDPLFARQALSLSSTSKRTIPWIASTPAGTFHAHLFFYGATPWPKLHLLGARIFTTVKRRPVSPKVLWTPHSPGAGTTLLISGTRLDERGHFSDRYPRASGNQFPSYVKVPEAGCWRVTVKTGTLVGTVTFAAVNSY